jgi:2,5-diamino-6-(ribosylamino)-4(3H)-pyrimidinone 5'-phosphate reductase
MLPRVIIHNAISVDGRIDWFKADIERFYELTSAWNEDATLAGSDTLISAYKDNLDTDDAESSAESAEIDRDDSRPILVVPDSRGRIRIWHLLRKEPYWKGIVVLCSQSTPESYLDYLKKKHINYIVAGDDHVDFRKALEEVNSRYGVNVVRVDSGGTLNGMLIRAGLVDEVSVLIHPCLVGGITPNSFFRAPDLTSVEGVVQVKIINIQRLDGDLLWVRYEVMKEANVEG